jgi:peptidoglycan/LPS O-acetylase OafA/YrhL
MSEQRKFIVLDCLRGIAALLVLTRHAPAFLYLVPPEGGLPGPPFFETYLAVDFFFVLSGFVLAHAYSKKLRDTISPWQFMAIRLIRLYPLYFLAILIPLSIALRQIAHGADARTIFTNAAFAVAFVPMTGIVLFPLNPPAWSLFSEIFANFFFALTERWLSFGWHVFVVGASASLLLAAVKFGWFGFSLAGRGAFDTGYQWAGLGGAALRVTYSFFAGTIIYRMWQTKPHVIRIHPAALIVLLGAALCADVPEHFRSEYDLLAVLILFPLIVYFGASSAAPIYATRFFSWLGAASYAIYVLQVPLYEPLLRLFSFVGMPMQGLTWPWSVGYIALILIAATTADQFYDKPVRALLSRLFLSRKAT